MRTGTLSCIFYCDAAGQQSQPLLVVRNAERIIGYWHVRLVLPPGRVSPEGAPASVQRKLPIPEHPASPNATDIDLTRMGPKATKLMQFLHKNAERSTTHHELSCRTHHLGSKASTSQSCKSQSVNTSRRSRSRCAEAGSTPETFGSFKIRA